MIARCCMLLCLFAGAAVVRGNLDAPRAIMTSEPLTRFPVALGVWKGVDLPLEADVIKVAAVNDFLNRHYTSDRTGLGLYIGYYQSQRQGEALHSPLFCLPGSGWQPIKTEQIDVRWQDGSSRRVNELVVERGLDRLLVLYWYQTFARVTASEYWRKLFLMHDAFVSGRTDVALVRIVAQIEGRDAGSEAASLGRARPFAELVLPEVQQRLFRD
jgi:EpsI family protein